MKVFRVCVRSRSWNSFANVIRRGKMNEKSNQSKTKFFITYGAKLGDGKIRNLNSAQKIGNLNFVNLVRDCQI